VAESKTDWGEHWGAYLAAYGQALGDGAVSIPTSGAPARLAVVQGATDGLMVRDGRGDILGPRPKTKFVQLMTKLSK